MAKSKIAILSRPVTSWNEVPVVFDIPMAARILGKSADWISRRCQRGELPAFKDGKEWRFEKDAFLDYIQSCKVTPITAKKEV